ncbi:MAG: NAD(P) transhydrogenase subunit alpha [Gemmatimonadales bacterium]|nr:MAG: NAD(P) transhydrogenase subunit alpha [Gemmatimonadales bacterium]
MIVGLFRERTPGERRVALIPPEVAALSDSLGAGFLVEAGAGSGAGVPDAAWEAAGARVVAGPEEVAANASWHLRVGPPDLSTEGEVHLPRSGATLLCLTTPPGPGALARAVSRTGGGLLALDRIPRSTRAQSMDVLSSQATVAGYRGALLGALHLPRFLPMLTTAAGTIRPARVLVLGAGVAGLQAMATARRLGAAVTGHDIRPAALEQIRSLGASTLQDSDPPPGAPEVEGGYARQLEGDEASAQEALLARRIGEFDMVVTTAQIPGRPAPRLVTTAMVESMPAGGVVVDLAAATGGNCQVSRPDHEVVHSGITVLAPTNPASGLPEHASAMFSRNVAALLRHLESTGRDPGDSDDEILRAITLVHEGRILDPELEESCTDAPPEGENP